MPRTKKSDDQSKPPSDKYRSTMEFKDGEEAGKFLRKHPLDLVETEILQKDGAYRLIFYLTEDEIGALKKEGYEPEVSENVSAIGRERQKEVGDGDRFDGGRIAPKPRGVTQGKEN